MSQDKYVYTPKEVSKILQIGKSKTYDLIREEVIPYIKLGRTYIIPPKEAFDEWLNTSYSGASQ